MFRVWVTVLLIVFCSCSSKQAAENRTGATKKQIIEKLPFLSFNVPDGYLYSLFNADIIDNPLSTEGKELFGDNIVYEFSFTYELYNKESTVNYYVIIFDFIKTIEKTDGVKYGDIIGKADGEKLKLLVFCKMLDPYLVINCTSMPRYYDDFYWFDGAFLFSPGHTKWLSFEPPENIKNILSDTADPVKQETLEEMYENRMKLFYERG